MTLRQEKLIQELPNNDNNVKKTALKVGYKESYADSTLYPMLRKSKVTKKYFDEKSIRRDTKRAYKKFWKEGDNANIQRNLEFQGKTEGITKETIKHEGHPEQIVINYHKIKSANTSN